MQLNSRILRRNFLLFSVCLVLSASTLAQEGAKHHVRYGLFEIPTFGGPNSVFNVGSPIALNRGTVVGAANTAAPDPTCFDQALCFVQHGWKWRRGKLIDLGVLPGGFSSYTNGLNTKGLVVGQSEDGESDPLTGAPRFVATVWDHGRIENLGTLGGGFSIAIWPSNLGFVMGAAENGIPDTSGFVGFDGVSQIRGFGWRDGQMFDLGTLGGTGAFPAAMNDLEAIVGISPTSSIAGPFGVPPANPFLWKNGKMQDLGTLGGSWGGANAISSRKEFVVGASSLAAQPYGCATSYFSGPGCRAFLWRNGHMYNLGTLGGSYSAAEQVNNAGEVSGFSGTNSQSFHSFFWKRGRMIDLGTVANDNFSRSEGINDKGQVVGQSWLFDGVDTTASHAFLWEQGGQMMDLNELILNSTDLYLIEAAFITDRGWIIAYGLTPNGDLHAAILVPENDLDEFGLGTELSTSGGNGMQQKTQVPPTPAMLQPLDSQWRRGFGLHRLDVARKHRTRYR